MFRKTWRTYVWVSIVLLGIDWFVGVARFHWSAFSHAFAVINLPWSILYLWIEKQPSVWWHEVFGSLVNDEIGQGISFLLMVALQAVLCTTLLLLCKRWRTQKQSSRVVAGRTIVDD